uniref:RRM domain-containing protein n=1 Tax=Tetradesmus obliquus TaxID=3088 RepID=A0A383VA07_TETOB|eukprot:jgi/Sobl393_1/17176/SZX61773.1
MADTGQDCRRSEQLVHQLRLKDNQLMQQQAQLAHWQGWCQQLAAAAPPIALNAAALLAARQVCVCGLPAKVLERDLATFFGELMAANGAVVAPGPAVLGCRLLRNQPDTALLELRCSVEASNCLAFDGVVFRGCCLNVQRPREYSLDAAVLLGPTQPDPAVFAALARGADGPQPAAQQQQQQQQQPPWLAGNQQPSSMGGPASGKLAGPGFNSSSGGNFSNLGRISSGPASGRGLAAASGPHSGSGIACRSMLRDLAQSADQSKQDEVFIGGLPSHWKAQQVKELLAPYGQLKSLSVAMDAATGKNKGYAFVVFASPAVVSRAIEELDCKAVEGKILAVQRATDGKAACGAAGGGSSSFPRDGGHSSLSSAAGMSAAGREAAAAGLGAAGGQELPGAAQQAAQPKYRSSNSSSGSSSSSSLGGLATGPHAAASALAAGGAAAAAAGLVEAEAMQLPQQQQQQAGASVLPHHRRTGSAPQQGCGIAPQPPAAAGHMVLPPNEGSTLGQRLLAAVTGAGGSSSSGGGSAAAAGLKQYDVNELYIGDLPLSWDEDAVRRLLGRYGKIKYFTLRNGRDKNFAFCKFKDSSVVDAAIQGLHGKIVDGYFLNVRRAIEGKQQQGQQQQPPQQWLGKQGGGRASFDAGRDSRMAQQRPTDQQQQQPGQGQGQQKVGGKGGVHGGRGQGMPAGGSKHGSGEWQQQQQGLQQKKQLHKPENSKAAAGVAADVAAGAAAQGTQQQQQQQQQQQDDNSSASTAPSPPDTPTAAPLAQQQQPAQAPGVAPTGAEAQQQQQQQQQASLFHPFLPTPAAQQQQQQQAPSLFLGNDTSGPASWGAPSAAGPPAAAAGAGFGLGGFLSQPAPQQPQQQQHSSMQTWDMLSPWSLFSNARSVW